MKNLNLHKLILLGNIVDKEYFQSFFSEIFLVKNNGDALLEHRERNASVVFLSCSDSLDNTIETAQKIRKLNRETSIILILEKSLKKIFLTETLFKALFLHLSGYIEKPFKLEEAAFVLKNIEKDLELFDKHGINLKDNYEFNKDSSILYNGNRVEIKLTKNEASFITTLQS